MQLPATSRRGRLAIAYIIWKVCPQGHNGVIANHLAIRRSGASSLRAKPQSFPAGFSWRASASGRSADDLPLSLHAHYPLYHYDEAVRPYPAHRQWRYTAKLAATPDGVAVNPDDLHIGDEAPCARERMFRVTVWS
jgi:hypothetical protein